MNSSQPCTGYWPYTIVISPRKQYWTSCNSITPILRSGLWMRPHRYQGALRSWNAFMNANNKTWSMAASTNDVTRIRVMQGITVTSNACSTHRGKTSLGDGGSWRRTRRHDTHSRLRRNDAGKASARPAYGRNWPALQNVGSWR